MESDKEDFDLGEGYYPTSFKLSHGGSLFVGNLHGNPKIISKGKIVDVKIHSCSTYDAIWISETDIIISSTWENRLIRVQYKNDDWTVVEVLKVMQPYRFSPEATGHFLLSSRMER